MYRSRVSPFTYLAEGMLSAALGDASVVCRNAELLVFSPVDGQTCNTYMEPYIAMAGGYLVDGSSRTECRYCTIASTNVFLNSFSYDFVNRWVSVGFVPWLAASSWSQLNDLFFSDYREISESFGATSSSTSLLPWFFTTLLES